MGFASFQRTIVSPALHNVVRHWNDARGSHRMPAWSDIRPAAIAAQLPIIWSYKYDRSSDSFTGRLAGERITAIFGKSLRGLPMREAYPKDEYPELFARTRRVVVEPAFARSNGIVFRHLDRHGIGERVILPLADDGETADGVLGATEYVENTTATFEPLAAGDVWEWFSFD